MDICHIAVLEQPLELGLDHTIGNIALRNQSPATRISVEREAAGEHIHRKASVLWVALAIVLVDENGTG
jgi:hypothetical protein